MARWAERVSGPQGDRPTCHGEHDAMIWSVSRLHDGPLYPPGACEHVRAWIDEDEAHWRRVRVGGERRYADHTRSAPGNPLHEKGSRP